MGSRVDVAAAVGDGSGIGDGGGTSPYLWAVTEGVLPDGLLLDLGTGVISGTPTAVESQTFTVTVTDSLGVTDSRQLTIAVIPQPLEITTASLPGGTVGVFYSTNLAASGGMGMPPYAYTWAIIAGQLPPGLTLSGTGVISGTAANPAKTYTFTVRVTDGVGVTASKQLSITVYK